LVWQKELIAITGWSRSSSWNVVHLEQYAINKVQKISSTKCNIPLTELIRIDYLHSLIFTREWSPHLHGCQKQWNGIHQKEHRYNSSSGASWHMLNCNLHLS
jgi:hypothetical protein